MVKREIIKIDEDKCTGCGLCIPNCPEGALQVIDGKARMISDLFCDGLGACIGHCPEGAIEIEEREAEPYDERKVMENVVKQGANTIAAHLKHMKDHGQTEFLQIALDYLIEKGFDIPEGFGPQKMPETLPCGCPGTQVRDLKVAQEPCGCPGETVKVIEPEPCGCGCDDTPADNTCNSCGSDPCQCHEDTSGPIPSQLSTWPVQMKLLPPSAPFFKDASLLIAADCTAFSLGSIQKDFIKDKVTLIGCPKLDDAQYYVDKLTEIFKQNTIKDITVLIMEVPCCGGLRRIVDMALEQCGKDIPKKVYIVGVKGDLREGG